MLLTLTPNPSIDATLEIPGIERGGVIRATATRREAGGKGINVSHAAALAGHPTLAVAPCGENDPFELAMRGLADLGVAFMPVTVSGAVRTNTAVTETDGTTTKFNEQGPELSEGELAELTGTVIRHAADADAVVLAGSLPPGAPDDFYAQLSAQLRTSSDVVVAVDTSDAPLLALGQQLDSAQPHVLKPNAFELAQLTGADGHDLESRAESGDFGPVIAAARSLTSRGAREILVTLGAAGACLVTADAAWSATPPPVSVRSTVGAGDSSLTGYLLARIEGAPLDECLRRAVAYGSAAASLPGTGLPSPDDLDLDNTRTFLCNN